MREGESMPLTEITEKTVEIPDGVQVEIDGRAFKVTGPKGTLREDLSHMPLNFKIFGKSVVVTASWPRKEETAMVGTAAARIRNMIKGVTSGFAYKLKVVHAHFPITVRVAEKDRKVLIENFAGEKTPRTAWIVGDANVRVAGDEITVEGINIEHVSQTAANIETATRIKDKDQRVFLDGIYIFEKKEAT